MLNESNMIEKILDDIGAAKAFSILAHSMNAILTRIGLLGSRPDVIKS